MNFETYDIPIFLLEPGIDTYTEEDNPIIVDNKQVEFEDLTFTLTKNSKQYMRPVVDLENYGPTIKGNNIFYRAAKKAGLEKLACDVNVETLKDKHFSQFNLIEQELHEEQYIHSIIFIDQYTPEFPTSEEILAGIESKAITAITHPKQSGIEYKLDIQKNEQDIQKITQQLFSNIKQYGSIRNINGIKPTL